MSDTKPTPEQAAMDTLKQRYQVLLQEHCRLVTDMLAAVFKLEAANVVLDAAATVTESERALADRTMWTAVATGAKTSMDQNLAQLKLAAKGCPALLEHEIAVTLTQPSPTDT